MKNAKTGIIGEWKSLYPGWETFISFTAEIRVLAFKTVNHLGSKSLPRAGQNFLLYTSKISASLNYKIVPCPGGCLSLKKSS